MACASWAAAVVVCPMKPEERDKLASERAGEYAPKPTGGLLVAGLSGAAFAFVADLAVSKFYGWRVADHWWIGACVSLVGLIIGLFIYATLMRRNRRAERTERIAIDKSDRQTGP